MQISRLARPDPYCGPIPEPHALWASWNLDPLLLGLLAVALIAGLCWLPRRGLVLTGWGLLVLVFVSPFCALTTVYLGARSLHHLAVFSVIAPIFAVVLPWRAGTLPLMATFCAGVMVAWHMPQVYTLAWQSHAIYWLLQAALLGSGWALWSHILRPSGSGFGHMAQDGMVIAGLAGVMGLIGAVLTFAPRVLFDQHLAGNMAWGTSALVDQQLAGLIMWVPGMGPLAVIAVLRGRRAWQGAQPA